MAEFFITKKPLPEGYTGRGYITNEEINQIKNYNNQQLKEFILQTVPKDKIFVNKEEKEIGDYDNENETEHEPVLTTILNMLRFLTNFSQSTEKNKININEKMIIVNMLDLYIYRNAYNMLSSNLTGGKKSKKHHKKTRKTKRRHHKK